MDDARWERMALLGGPVFIVLVVVGGFLAGSPPAPDASAQEVFDFFKDNTGALQAGAIMGTVAALFAAFWVGSIWRAMRRAEAGEPRLTVVAALGFVLAGANALAAQAIFGAVTVRIDSLGPEGAQVFFTLSNAFGAALLAGAAAQVGAVAVLGWHSGFIPRWLTGLSALATVLFILGIPGVASDDTIWFGFTFAAFVTWTIWILVFTWHLWNLVPTNEPAAA